MQTKNNRLAQVDVHILGSGDAFSSGGKLNTCFLIKGSEAHVLLDCGATSLMALKKNKIPSDSITVIALSHFHGDHYAGIPFILLDRYFNGDRTRPLKITGPSGTIDRVKKLTDLLYSGTEYLFEDMPVEFIDYSTDTAMNIGGVKLQAFNVIHSEPALPHGLKVEIDDLVIAYSGDTEWTDTLIKLADGADLFICECSAYEQQLPGHLHYQFLKEQVARFNCKKMVLTHLGEKMLERIEDLELPCAKDGQIIALQ